MKLPVLILLLSVALFATGCNRANHSDSGSSRPLSQSNNQAGQPSAQSKQSPSQCDPNYSPCVPIASDVDCAGGGGNGPAYVRGPIKVIGSDIYDLDRDGDGVGCE